MFCLIQTSPAQNTPSIDSSYALYPLQVGNLWQFYTYDFVNGQTIWEYGWTTKILGDTVMPDGKIYAIETSDYSVGASYLRQEGPRVIIYSGFYGQPVLYDFSKSIGDTLFAVLPPGRKDSAVCVVKALYSDNIFNLQRKTWQFYTTASRSSAFICDYVTDGIGMTTQKAEAGLEWFLRGAIINGVKYGIITVVKENDHYVGPKEFALYPNYPNPFNPSTTISFSLPSRSFVTLKIFDVMGREVSTIVSEEIAAGSYQRQWNASGFPSGVYFYRLQAGAYTETKRLVLVR
jgi:hypothetical protein